MQQSLGRSFKGSDSRCKKYEEPRGATALHGMAAGHVPWDVDAPKGQVAQRAGSAIVLLLEQNVAALLLILRPSRRVASLAMLCIIVTVLLIDVLAVGLVVDSVVHEGG